MFKKFLLQKNCSSSYLILSSWGMSSRPPANNTDAARTSDARLQLATAAVRSEPSKWLFNRPVLEDHARHLGGVRTSVTVDCAGPQLVAKRGTAPIPAHLVLQGFLGRRHEDDRYAD